MTIPVEDARRILEHYGMFHQLIKLAEECSELSKEAIDYYMGKGDEEKLIDEISDVMIMVSQAIIGLNLSEEAIGHTIRMKIERQMERIRKEEEKNGEET